MYLFVFVGLAWLLTAPAMAVLIGKVIRTADGHARPTAHLTLFDAELARRRPAAGRR